MAHNQWQVLQPSAPKPSKPGRSRQQLKPKATDHGYPARKRWVKSMKHQASNVPKCRGSGGRMSYLAGRLRHQRSKCPNIERSV